MTTDVWWMLVMVALALVGIIWERWHGASWAAILPSIVLLLGMAGYFGSHAFLSTTLANAFGLGFIAAGAGAGMFLGRRRLLAARRNSPLLSTGRGESAEALLRRVDEKDKLRASRYRTIGLLRGVAPATILLAGAVAGSGYLIAAGAVTGLLAWEHWRRVRARHREEPRLLATNQHDREE